MTWINTVSYEQSQGRLRELYDRVKGPDNNVDNIMMSHSLRPHTMEGHMAIYKYVLHHTGNSLPKWYLETIGVWTSLLNDCAYCVEHHFAGLCRLLADDQRANAIRSALEMQNVEATPLSEREQAGLFYARKLTQSPSSVTEQDIARLRDAGFDDGEILEINQVTSYFCYANRTVLGLGCSVDGDVLGLSPNNSQDPNDWSHT